MLLLLFVLPGFCLWAAPAPCQSSSAQEQQNKFKRLILKDGSYELIDGYAIQGDRVRYFSTERNSWEELPYSLVDWEATKRYAGVEAGKNSERIKEALDRAAGERSEEETHAPLVAPGVRLPSQGGVFLLDVYRSNSELNALAQNGADLNKNTGSNILRGVINPVAGSRQTMELKGLHARVQSHVPEPAIYVAVDPNDPLTGYDSKTAKDHLRIVRCEEKKDNRVVVSFDIAIYGKVKQRAQYIDARIEPVSNYWVRVTPATPLQTGEYALVEVDDKGSMNQFVWDFGVNPDAPANPAIMLTNPGRSEPILIQKPKTKANP
jgi:hypothetical protein